MPGGRPTKYHARRPAEVADVMGRGFSLSAYAGEIGVSRSTVDAWRAAYPVFAEAVRVGQARRTAKLERDLLDLESTGPRITARLFALKMAAPEEWREQAAPPPEPVNVTVRFVDPEPRT